MNNFYEAVGGEPVFETLVKRFFEKVSKDELLMTMYKAEELEESAWRLKAYLELLWGGPRTYEEFRGAPRLRVRHMEFKIDSEARECWMSYMRESIKSLNLHKAHELEMLERMEQIALAMQNHFTDAEKKFYKRT
jgi:hemoglobin